MHWDQTEGAYNAEKYDNFLQTLLPMLPLDSMLIMDNLQAHRGKLPAETIRKIGQVTEFLPPFSPQLNPVEHVFASIVRSMKEAVEEFIRSNDTI